MGLCLVAAFALTAIGAGTASALPEVGRCVAKAGTGKYKDANCQLKAGSLTSEKQFEFVKSGVKLGFTSHITSGTAVLETVTGTKVQCTGQTATGKYDADGSPASIKGVENVIARFTGCSTTAIEGPCGTEGAGSGEIVTNELEGSLGYIKKTAPKSVGQELKPASTVKSKLFVKFACGVGGPLTVEVGQKPTGTTEEKGGDCIIAPVEPFNVMAETASQNYSGAGGVQNPQKFEGSTKKCNLESHFSVSSVWERSTQTLLTTVNGEEALEIKA